MSTITTTIILLAIGIISWIITVKLIKDINKNIDSDILNVFHFLFGFFLIFLLSLFYDVMKSFAIQLLVGGFFTIVFCYLILLKSTKERIRSIVKSSYQKKYILVKDKYKLSDVNDKYDEELCSIDYNNFYEDNTKIKLTKEQRKNKKRFFSSSLNILITERLNEYTFRKSISKRKIGYIYEFDIYEIFDQFERFAITNKLLVTIQQKFSVYRTGAQFIVDIWREIEDNNGNDMKLIYNTQDVNEVLEFKKTNWECKVEPLESDLLVAIVDHYSIDIDKARDLLKIWKANDLVECYNQRYKVGSLLRGCLLNVQNRQVKNYLFGELIEIEGGDKNRITETDISYNQWKMFKYSKINVLLVFQSVPDKYKIFKINELEAKILVAHLFQLCNFKSKKEARSFLEEKWMKFGFVKKNIYCSKGQKVLTYEITELYILLSEHFRNKSKKQIL